MELDVHTYCAYYPVGTRDEAKGRWDSTKFCLAVKSGTVNGWFTLPGNGGGLRVGAGGVGVQFARKHFGRWVAAKVQEAGMANVLYVPAPSKDSFKAKDFRSLSMLREALPQSELGKLSAALAYNAELEQASHGGPRGYQVTLPHLMATTPLAGKAVILVDDVVTSGGTLLACKTVIENNGGKVVLAIACGRTDEFEAEPFSKKVISVSAHPSLF